MLSSSFFFSRAIRHPFCGIRPISMLSNSVLHITQAGAPSTHFIELQARLDVMEQKLSGKEQLLKDKEEQLKASQRSKEERLKDKEELLMATKRHFKYVELVYLRNLAQAKLSLDEAKGSVHARGVFEASVEELWAEACIARQMERATSSGPPSLPELTSSTTSDKWLQLLNEKGGASPPLILSFQQAAKDNGLSPKSLLHQARELYNVLSENPHALPTAGVVGLPLGILSLKELAVAFCVPIVATMRDPRLYSTVSRGLWGAWWEGEQVWMRSPSAKTPTSLKDLRARALVEMVIVKDFYVHHSKEPPYVKRRRRVPRIHRSL